MSLREQLQADLKAICFSTADFAEEATFTPAGGSVRAITGIYRAGGQPDTYKGSKTIMTDPQFQCSQSDVSSASKGDTLRITSQSKTWYVRDGQLKTNGSFVIFLSEDAQ